MINGAVNSCISHLAINTVLLLNVVDINKLKNNVKQQHSIKHVHVRLPVRFNLGC